MIRQTKEGIWIIDGDSHISKWVEEKGQLQHDFQTLPLVLPEIPVGGVVVDVGAFIGDSTAPFLERVGPTGKVIAFEPNMDAHYCLKLNCPAAETHCVALSDITVDKHNRETWVSLSIPENAGAAFISRGDHSVCQWRMDDLLDELDRLDFIKIDVEGYELRVLRGAEKTIQKFRPKMLIEINEGALKRQGTTVTDLLAWIHDRGYGIRIVQDDIRALKNPFKAEQYDVLCTPSRICVSRSSHFYPNPQARCDTCKWWDAPTKYTQKNAYGNLTTYIEELGKCRNQRLWTLHPNRPIDSPPISKPDDAHITNFGEVNDFTTGPKFGCVHHEPASWNT